MVTRRIAPRLILSQQSLQESSRKGRYGDGQNPEEVPNTIGVDEAALRAPNRSGIWAPHVDALDQLQVRRVMAFEGRNAPDAFPPSIFIGSATT